MALAAYEHTIQQRRGGGQVANCPREPHQDPHRGRQLYREGPSDHGGSNETRQLAEDAERLLAHRKEKATILAAAAEKRMARNMGVVLGTSAAPTHR